MKNVAWAVTRHHNLEQVARILCSESNAFAKAGLQVMADELLHLSCGVSATKLELERVRLELANQNQNT